MELLNEGVEHAQYVWAAYGFTMLVLAGLVAVSCISYIKAKKRYAELKQRG